MYKRTQDNLQYKQGRRRYLEPDNGMAKDTSQFLVEAWNEPLEENKDTDIAFDAFLVKNGMKLC